MSEKLCVFCKHFNWEAIETESVYYSTLTGGDVFTNGGMQCKKRHYNEVRPDDTDEFRKVIQQAAKCPDYAEVK
jgi:hypothetical protein